jgi:hypothetical protein
MNHDQNDETNLERRQELLHDEEANNLSAPFIAWSQKWLDFG